MPQGMLVQIQTLILKWPNQSKGVYQACEVYQLIKRVPTDYYCQAIYGLFYAYVTRVFPVQFEVQPHITYVGKLI